MLVTVIICSYNPREHYFLRVLDALRQQTLDSQYWNIIIVDNKSRQPIKERFLDVIPANAEVVVEEKQGLTAARLKGIKSSIGEILVFVDDDNVLDADYLEQAIMISKLYPKIGAWGGSCVGEFEVPPEAWIHSYLEGLAVKKIETDVWGNFPGYNLTTPYGAGMCVRREIANHYMKIAIGNPVRLGLDRSGTTLISGGDTDIALTSISLGFGNGKFSVLNLKHLISKERLQKNYIIRLYASFAASGVFLKYLWPEQFANSNGRVNAFLPWVNFFWKGKINRQIFLQSQKAKKEANKILVLILSKPRK